jgi:hypothetical protein
LRRATDPLRERLFFRPHQSSNDTADRRSCSRGHTRLNVDIDGSGGDLICAQAVLRTATNRAC